MRRIRVIPLLLLQRGGLVKSVKYKNHQYVGDPINAVRIFNEKEVDEIIVLDISATPEKRAPHIDQIAEISGEAFMPFAYGGGITKLEQAQDLFYQGAEKVVLNHSALENPDLITQIAKRYGNQSVVVSIDVRRSLLGANRVYGHGGKRKSKWKATDFARHVRDLGAGEIMLTSIDRDGTFSGYDYSLITDVSEAVDIPIIACGGASGLSSFRKAVDHGASAVAAGSFFVFQMPHRAVLVSYPTQDELVEHVFSKI